MPTIGGIYNRCGIRIFLRQGDKAESKSSFLPSRQYLLQLFVFNQKAIVAIE